MTLFLTSSPCAECDGTVVLSPHWGFLEHLQQVVPGKCRALYICSSPDDERATDYYAAEMKAFFERSGFSFDRYEVLDRRTSARAKKWIEESDLLILAGGHVPTQNRFFEEMGLKQLLRGYKGVVLGISAGTMNCASVVYAHPEEEGEAIDPDYRRYLPGLGLTELNILPHFSQWREQKLDGLRMLEDIAAPDSFLHPILILEDGSYVMQKNGKERIFGPHYWLKNGILEFFTNKLGRNIK